MLGINNNQLMRDSSICSNFDHIRKILAGCKAKTSGSDACLWSGVHQWWKTSDPSFITPKNRVNLSIF